MSNLIVNLIGCMKKLDISKLLLSLPKESPVPNSPSAFINENLGERYGNMVNVIRPNLEEPSHESYPKVNLDDHVNTVHKPAKEFTCQQCSYQFTTRKSIDIHDKSPHIKIRCCDSAEEGRNYKSAPKSSIDVPNKRLQPMMNKIYCRVEAVKAATKMMAVKYQCGNYDGMERGRPGHT